MNLLKAAFVQLAKIASAVNFKEEFIDVALAHEIFDVPVIGGGFSGLACVDAISRSKKSVCFIEGNARLGGRVFGKRMQNLNLEMDAEFIHGVQSEVLGQVELKQRTRVDVSDKHLLRFAKQLHEVGFCG